MHDLPPFSRRQLLGALAVTMAARPASAAAAVANESKIARGKVYSESSEGSRGVSGVLVTNGVDVTTTDTDGRYELPLNGDCVISIIKPAGYAVPLQTGTNLARFYYVHQPEGTPAALGLSGPTVAPTGSLPGSVDFRLSRSNEPEKFEAILFADPQPETNEDVDNIRDGVIAALAGSKPAFGLTLGDITGDNLSLYPRINALVGQIGAPWYCAIGNHDLNFEARDNAQARETFRRFYGPTHYAFEYGRALFIVLDNIVYHGFDRTKPNGAGDYHDDISDDQLRFVSNVLRYASQDRLVVLCMHIPLKSKLASDGREIAVGDCAALLDIVGERPCVSFAGHTHMAERRYIYPTEDAPAERAHRHQVLATVSGAWWSGPMDPQGVAISDCCDGTPAAHYVLAVDGHHCNAHIQPTISARRGRLRAVLADRAAVSRIESGVFSSRLTLDQLARADLVVNVFDGGAREKVEFRIDDHDTTPMTRAHLADPFVAAEYARNRDDIKPYVAAEHSTHLWLASLPANLAAGVHRIQVEAVDEFGGTSHESLLVEIVRDEGKIAMGG